MIEQNEVKLRIEFEYDEQDNEITQTEYMSTDGGENWMEYLGDVNEYTYDSEGRCIESKTKYYDEDSAAYVWGNKKLYTNFYAAPNLSVENSSDNLVVYPNPANGLINIKGEVTAVAIYSIQGQVVKSIFGKSKNPSIDISDLNQGYYCVSFTLTDGSSVTQKLQVQ